MKIKLPHKKVDLDMNLPLEKRLEVVNKLLKEVVNFHEKSMTVEEYFRATWNKNSTKTCMDIIGYYLTKQSKDISILSQLKEREIKDGSKRYVSFSVLGEGIQSEIGLIDLEEN